MNNLKLSSYFNIYCLILDPLYLLANSQRNYEILHWLVGNIPGNHLKKGDLIARYVGSQPPEGTGMHQYVFLLFKQNGKICYEESLNPDR